MPQSAVAVAELRVPRKRGRPCRYPWDKWSDGVVRTAVRGRDFAGSSHRFCSSVLAYARTRSMTATAVVVDRAKVWFFLGPAPESQQSSVQDQDEDDPEEPAQPGWDGVSPTPEQIACECLKLQAGWSPEEFAVRAGLSLSVGGPREISVPYPCSRRDQMRAAKVR